jgi:hypothetical protein
LDVRHLITFFNDRSRKLSALDVFCSFAMTAEIFARRGTLPPDKEKLAHWRLL